MASNEAVTTIKINYDGDEAVRGLKTLKNTVGTVVSALAVKEIYRFTNALAEMGAEGLNAERAFSQFVPNVIQATHQMKKASLNMMEETKLQQKATQALISGINFDDYLVALEYASKFSVATGKDVEETLSRMLNSFLTGRNIGLKQAGITVATGKNMVVDAVNQMKTKMKELDTSIDDPLIKTKQLNAEMEDLKDKMGRDLIPVVNTWNQSLLTMGKGIGFAFDKVLTTMKLIANEQAGMTLQESWFEVNFENAKKLGEEEEKTAALFKMKTEVFKRYSEVVDQIRIGQERMQATANLGKPKDITLENALIKLRKEELSLKGQDLRLTQEINKADKVIAPGGPKDLTEDQIKKEMELEKAALQFTHAGRLKAIEQERDFMIKEYGTSAKAIANINKIQDRKRMDEEKAMMQRRSKAIQDEQDMQRVMEESFSSNTLTTEERIRSEQEADEEIRRLRMDGALSQRELIDANLQYELQKNKERAFNGYITLEQSKQMELELIRISEQQKLEIYEETAQRMLSGVGNLNEALSSLSDAQTNKEIKNLDQKKMGQKKYDKEVERIQAAGEERQKTFARVQQILAVGQTTMDMARAIMKSHATLPPPFNWVEAGLIGATGLTQIATIQAQKFQRGFLGDPEGGRSVDNISAMIGKNEAVIPGPQYAMHQEDIRAIVNNTANTAAGMRALRGGSVVHQYYGLSSEQVIAVQRDAERRKYTGRLI